MIDSGVNFFLFCIKIESNTKLFFSNLSYQHHMFSSLNFKRETNSSANDTNLLSGIALDCVPGYLPAPPCLLESLSSNFFFLTFFRPLSEFDLFGSPIMNILLAKSL